MEVTAVQGAEVKVPIILAQLTTLCLNPNNRVTAEAMDSCTASYSRNVVIPDL